MDKLVKFLKSNWEQIAWTVVYVPLVLTAAQSGDWQVIALTVVIGAVSLLALYSLINKIQHRRQPTFGGPASQLSRRGIVFTVGLQKETIVYTLAGQHPECIGFLCTEDSLKTAAEVADSYAFTADNFHREIVDPRNIDDVRVKTSLVFDWMINRGLSVEDIVLDPTGGLTPMSLGAFSVAQERGIDSQYVRSRYDEHNRPLPGTQELVFVSRFTAAM